MKRRKRIRIGAFALAVAMTVTMMPMDVQAVQELDPSELKILPTAGETVPTEDTASTLDVSQFAMRDDLMTKFDTNETTRDIGDAKVYFGENGSEEKQEWWIAGEDPWDIGLVLFAASPLGEKQIFQQQGMIPSLQKYDKTWECAYDEGKKIDYVYDNHYGGSKLRAKLKKIETDLEYFSDSEQKLMQTTTIYTEDMRKGRKIYSTEDKLYAAYGGDIYNAKKILIGSNTYDELASGLQVSPDYRYEERFWLRSPDPSGNEDTVQNVLVSFDGKDMNYYNCINGGPYAVVPAFQLDTSDVLFGSKIPAVQNFGDTIISEKEAFTLRYDAGDELGSAEISADKQTITVTGVPSDSKLVVQTKTGANCLAIPGEEPVSAPEMGLQSFENCKVWVEKTGIDGITKATLAEEKTGKPQPEAPVIEEWSSTANSITFTEPDPGENTDLVIEYSMDNGLTWVACDGFFENLEPETAYTILARYQENKKYSASESVTLRGWTTNQYLVEVSEEIIDDWTTDIGDNKDTYSQSGIIKKDPIIPISIKAKDGYYFPKPYTDHFKAQDLKGLKVERIDDKQIQITGIPSGDVRLLIPAATSEPEKYTLTFDANGGSAIPSVTVTKGESINLSKYTPTRSGYRFTGWYSDEALKNRITSITLNDNKTVYAGWTKESPTVHYALHFDTNGGNEIPSLVGKAGETIDLAQYIPVRDGYTFTGWYADETLTERVSEVKLDRTRTIYAGWEKDGPAVDTKKDQAIYMTVAAQERDLKNGSRNTMSKVCTLKLGFAVDDSDLSLTYTTSDPEVAIVEDGKITYQGVGSCVITVTAKETKLCKATSRDIKVVVGKLGTPTFTPSVTANTAQKAFVVTSSTVRGVDGWEVQYSIRDDWWRATTKDFPNTGTKLYRKTCTTVHSDQTYYIRVRGYQMIDGEKVYSDWSPAKTIQTK